MRAQAVRGAVALWAGVALTACGDAAPGERPNVVLIVVDTLRADALGAYGSETGDTPVLDGFAKEAVVFERASTPRAKTNPAVASLLTGTYPPEHGVRDLGRPLPARLPTLAEAFRDAGWRTAAIVGNFVLTRERSGFDRGFESWTETLPDSAGGEGGVPERRAPSLVDGALEQLDAFGDAPFFLYLHAMDPHGPYEPPLVHRVVSGVAEPLEPPHPPVRWQTPTVAERNVPAEARLADGRIDTAAVREAYRGEVRFVDAELGRLFAELDRRGLTDDTIVVVTADHGESLGEHAYWFEHGLHAYEATCHVPLMLRVPARPSERRDDPASLVDVAPTLAAQVGLEQRFGDERTEFRGRDLFASVATRSFSEKAEGADLARALQIDAVRDARWKLIRRFALDDVGRRRLLAEELFDLEHDVQELVDLIAVPGTAPLAELRAALDAWRAFDDRFDDAPERAADEDELARLRAMGYLGR
ncbi:MAG: sulfatase [Planctomycetota bacterium]